MSGYKKNSVIEGGVLKPIDIAIFCSNSKDGLTVKHSRKTINEKEAEKFVKGLTFYHSANTFKKRSYDDTLKKDKHVSSEYINRTNEITVKEYGKKIFTGTVDEWDAKGVTTTTIMIIHAVAEMEKDGKPSFFRVAIFLTGSGRAATFNSKFEDASIFKLAGRKSTKQERDESKFGEFVYHPVMQDPEEEKEYDLVNSETEGFAKEMRAYFKEKGLMQEAKPVVPPTVNEAPTEGGEPAATNGADDDLPF